VSEVTALSDSQIDSLRVYCLRRLGQTTPSVLANIVLLVLIRLDTERARADQAERRVEELEHNRALILASVHDLRAERARLLDANATLRGRVEELEQVNADLAGLVNDLRQVIDDDLGFRRRVEAFEARVRHLADNEERT
jgi:predicted RNase H-like nuclease (RuvC/YqgF family)